MKKEDRVYEMEKLCVEEINKKFGINLTLYHLTTIDVHDDGRSLIAIYEQQNSIYSIQAIYYARACFPYGKKKPHIFICDRFVKEQDLCTHIITEYDNE